jgi:hypothetical protein
MSIPESVPAGAESFWCLENRVGILEDICPEDRLIDHEHAVEELVMVIEQLRVRINTLEARCKRLEDASSIIRGRPISKN